MSKKNYFVKYVIFFREFYFILKSQIKSVVTSLKIINSKSFQLINFHPLAGKIIGGKQYLFDGSPIIYPHGSDKVHNLYRFTQGAPEPEEIIQFLKIIKNIRKNGTMIEIGAGGGFYSIIASKYLTFGKLILVEPNPRSIMMLKQNIVMNKFDRRAVVIQRAVTDKDNNKIRFKESGYASAINTLGEYSVLTITIDSLVKNLKLHRVDLLHMDIQGEEYNALQGMKKSLSHQVFNYIFIGTHSIEIHKKCENYLREKNYSILFSQDITISASYDGILIAKVQNPRHNDKKT